MAAGDIEIIARVAHETLRALAVGSGGEALASWDEAEPWQRRATLAGVRYRLEHPEAGAHALHESWADEMRALGWSFGPVKDAAKKTHPSLVPYESLPPADQLKDRLFLAVVAALSST